MKLITKLFFLYCLLGQIAAYTSDNISCWKTGFQAGLAPTTWSKRGQLTAISCNATSVLSLQNAVIPLFDMPQFNKLFHVPWLIGGYLYHVVDDETEFFVQSDYKRASAHTFTIPALTIPQIDTLSFSIVPQNHYQTIDLFFGLQRNYACTCYDFLLWYGAKVGLVHRKKVDAVFITESLTVPFENQTAAQELITKSTSPAIGLLFALEGCVCNDLSWNLRFEFVASCGPHLNQNISFDFATQSVLINPLLAPNNFIFNGITTEFYFPISFGFKYAL